MSTPQRNRRWQTETVSLVEAAEKSPALWISDYDGARWTGAQYVRRCTGCGTEFDVHSYPPGYRDFCTFECVNRALARLSPAGR